MKKAVAILANGSIRHLAREAEPMPVYSLAKPLIAAAIVASNVDVQSPVSTWIEKNWLPEGDNITVEHLLQHRSGIRDYGANPAYARAIESGELWSDEEFANITTRKPLLFKPGESFNYSNPGYWLLTQVLQRQTGLSHADALQKLVLEPLALHETQLVTGQFASDLPEYPADWVWHGVVMSSTHDMLKFMASEIARDLSEVAQPVTDPGPHWQKAFYGYGVMIEAGMAYGHNGNGPGYSASCFYFNNTRQAICVLKQSTDDDAAFTELRSLCDWD